jgi:hypothetical protein
MKTYNVIVPVIASGNISIEIDAENELEAAQKALDMNWDNPEQYETLGWDSELAEKNKFPTTAEELVAEGLVEEDE